jgi:hypothetical protein
MDKAQKKKLSVNSSVFFLVYTWWFGDTGLGWALYGPVQSDLDLHDPIWSFICKFKITSRIYKHQI